MLLSPQHAGFGDLSLKTVDHTFGAPHDALKDQGYFGSGCSRHMIGYIYYLTNFKEHDRGYVAFGGGAKCGNIFGKGTIKTGKLDFEDVYFVKELKFNLFSVSQMCDKKNSVLFTDTECFVLSPNFKLADESQVLLKVPRKNNMYSFDMKNIVPKKDLTCLIAKAAKAVNTACYVQNRVLVVKPYFKTLYELFKGRSSALSIMRPFGCHVTILNTLNQLGKFDGKSDEGIFVGYSTTSGGPEWLFDIDALSKSMNYAPVFAGTNSNDFAGKGASSDAGQYSMETGSSQDYILMPLWNDNSLFDSSSPASYGHNKDKHATPTYADYPNDPLMPDLEDARIFDDAYDDKDEGAKADYNNLEIMEPKKTLVDLPPGKRAIGTKWVYRNKRDQREGCNVLSEKLPDLDSTKDLHPQFYDNPLSGSTTDFPNSLLEEFTGELALITYPPEYYDNLQFDIDTTYSANSLLEEFANELALISYPPDYDDNHACDIESDIREIEFLHYQGEDSDFKDLIDQSVLTNRDDLFVDPTPKMFSDEQPPDYSFPPRFDVYPDDFLEIESDANFDNDSFDSEGEKIKEAKLLIDQLDLPCDILSEYDSFASQDFSRDDVLPSPDNEDKVINPGILIHKKSISIITRVTQEKKLAISFASLLFEDFDPPFYELLVFKEVPNSMRLLPFSSENEEKVFKPGIYTSKKFHCCVLSELSHPGFHVFKVNMIFLSLMKIFPVQNEKNTPPLDVLLFHFYPP
nr:ribonuclease H-like domain-containing protein [Tanacetum cinerariifolium]